MKDKLKNTRQSVGWFGEELGATSWGKRSESYYYSAYTHMLIDDVRLKIMPVPDYSKKAFKILLNPTEREIEKVVSEGLGNRNDWRRLSSAVHEFFGMCASSVLAHEEAHYEIVYFLDEEEKPVEFRLVFIPSSSLSLQKQEFIQHIPQAIVQQRNLPSNQVRVSPNVVLTFRLPEYVRNNFSHTMESLEIIGREVFPSFATEIIFRQRKGYFDNTRFMESKHQALAHATRLIGWNGRQTINESTLEYYQLHRHLLFERFIVELRNEILTTLNEGLRRAGNQIGFSAQIVIEGLPTLVDVENAETQLRDGLCKFEDIMKPFYFF